MGKRVAIVIAVENYSDSRIKKVSYAEADAQGFADALEVAGPIDKVLLLSAKATKTSINSKIGISFSIDEGGILQTQLGASASAAPNKNP
jgi:hypothetical protein